MCIYMYMYIYIYIYIYIHTHTRVCVCVCVCVFVKHIGLRTCQATDLYKVWRKSLDTTCLTCCL